MRRKLGPWLAAALLLTAASASAGAVSVLSLLLTTSGSAASSERSVQRFLCVFDQHVSPETGRISRDNPLRYEFVVDGTGHAFAVARNVYPVEVITGDQGITFLEVLKTGAVQTTTIHKTGSAVHSRHTMLSVTGEIVPSQYYGVCK